MGTLNWNELFPGRWSAVIFISYMALFVNQGIIVTWSQNDKKYEYNTITVVLMTEVLKLIVSIIFYCRENTILQLFKEIQKYKDVLILYMVPAFLYCLYNNLAFINLAAFDPTTYYLLLQLRVVMTGIVFQVIFKKYLSTMQWISLLLLTLGCMIKHLNVNIKEPFSLPNFYLGINTFYIFIQTMCSCLAGVYNEYLLKRQGADINIFVQNVFMYIDSILCNIVVLAAHGSLLQTFDSAGPSIFLQPKVILIIINNTAIGIITSFFLKNLNSILKNFASALELIFTAILSWILFGIPIYINTVLAIAIVSYSVLLYSRNPVQNAHPEVREINTDMKESVPLSKKIQTV
ncbi:UDP-galactose transporter senju [Cephus cinctus]|uniref:UDP-galactose transporter senju n=1 Tax=Cephus cinctus TaxID=211228 RepID=A0AAJ7C4F2_CEPCN|nr:UDP-galactose transporter senju [Cephus cinctus]